MLNREWKILLSLPNGLTCGGMTTWAIRTASALGSPSRQVVILAHQPPDGLTEFRLDELDLPRHVSVQQLPTLTDDANRESILRHYTRLLPAVIIPSTHETSFEIAASLALAAPSRVRMVGWNHSDHEYDYACLTHIETICESFIVNTNQCRRELAERIPHRAAEIHQHPHIIETLAAAPHRRAGNGAIRLGYAGRLEESAKRVSDLIEIAYILRNRGISFTLKIMGDGPARAQIAASIERFRETPPRRSLAAQELLAPQCAIEWLPPQPPTRTSAFWKNCDCLLLPSAYEGLNYQMLEAMAAGCIPIVSAIESGAEEFIQHGVNGLNFAIGDCNDAADCISALSKSAALREKLAANAFETIGQACQPEATIRAIDAILRNAVNSKPRSWPHSLPVSMRDGEARSNEAADGIERMRAALQSLADAGRSAVAIYGAGRHSRMIAAAFTDAPVSIHGFIDDDPVNLGRRLFDRPIVSRDDAITLDVDAIVISSRMNEKQILQLAPRFAAIGIEMIPLYTLRPDTTPGSLPISDPVSHSNTASSNSALATGAIHT